MLYIFLDSLLTFPTHPDAPPLESLCEISERLGCLKIEKSGITKFFSQAAKTYAYETVDGELTLKAKGFNMLEKLLKDNFRQNLLETNMTEMFSSLVPDGLNLTSVKVFQKQIKVNPNKGIPALIPRAQSYKTLNFVGPRRQIDVGRWLDFEYKRVSVRAPAKINPLYVKETSEDVGCDKSLILATETEVECQDVSMVRLVPKILGILPALPFGFDVNRLVDHISFYNLTV